MKNLKKLLALVLVAVMVLSFGAISASAAFTDTASSNYQEAIGVLSGIGVINGTTATTYEPTGSLTRAAAAKVITYMLLGPANAALISSATAQTFSDVPTTHWASGYIDYCASIGIIAGTGDGTFNPEGTLTTLAFTKMLLVALGYNADIEGYVGSNWAINIASDALSAGVFDSTIPMSANATCTREQAAQLAFKALLAITVQYQGGSTITIGNNTITTGATRSDVPNNTATDIFNPADNLMEFAEKYFPKLSKSPAFIGGRNGYFWMNGTDYITGFISNDVVLASKTSGTAYSDLTNPAKSKYVGFMADADPAVTYYYNDLPASASYPALNASDDTLGENITAIQGRVAIAGVIVNFIDTDQDNKYDVVAVIDKTVERLAAAPTVRTSGSLTYVTIGSLGEMDTRYVIYPEGLVKEDVILWYQSGVFTYVEKAAVVTGTISSHNVLGMKIGDTTYGVSGLAGSSHNRSALEALLGKASYTFYVDNGNNICYVAAPSGAATLTNTYLVTATDTTTSFGVTTYKAAVVAPDGTASVITVKKTASFGGTPTKVNGNTAGVSTSGNLGAGVFYTYTKNADDTYNLTAAENQGIYATNLAVVAPNDAINAGDTSYTVSRAKALFLTKVTAAAANWTTPTPTSVESTLATSNTVFLYFNPTTLTYNVFTGIANAPSYSAGGTVYVLEDSTGVYAQVVVCIGGTSSAVTTTVDTIFVSSGATTTLDALSNPVYTYTVVKNGVASETVSSYVPLTAGNVYFVNDYNADGIINSAPTSFALATAHASVTDIAYAAGTIYVDAASDAAYILSSDAKIFMYNKDTFATTQISAEAAAAFNYSTGTHKLTVVEVSSTNDAIAAVYITVDPA